MSGPKRNPDRLNTIGIVVVGICGAVLVYTTIVALQAFYVNDTSEIQTMADYGGQDTGVKSLRADQVNRITAYGTNPRPAQAKPDEVQRPQTYRIPIDVAMKHVIDDAKTDPGALIPTLGRSDKSTVQPVFGRPRPLAEPGAAPAPAGGAAPAAPAGAASTAPAAPAGAASAAPAAPAGAASAAPAAPAGAASAAPTAPTAPTGAGTGPAPVAGAGALDKAAAPGTPGQPTSPTPGKAPAGPAAAGAATHAGPAAKPAAPAPSAPPKGNGK